MGEIHAAMPTTLANQGELYLLDTGIAIRLVVLAFFLAFDGWATYRLIVLCKKQIGGFLLVFHIISLLFFLPKTAGYILILLCAFQESLHSDANTSTINICDNTEDFIWVCF